VNNRLFERKKDSQALDEAIAHERSAIEAWRQLVAAAGDFYTEDLMMGVRGASLCGHWKDELTALERDLATLERRQRELKPNPDAKRAPRFPPSVAAGDVSAPLVMHQPVTTAPVGQPIAVSAEVRDPVGVKWVRLRYRSVNQHQDYRTLAMVPTGDKAQYRTVIPADDIPPTWDLMYFIEAMDKNGNGRIYPDLKHATPYIVVKLQR
jgi:hypothetical protein